MIEGLSAPAAPSPRMGRNSHVGRVRLATRAYPAGSRGVTRRVVSVRIDRVTSRSMKLVTRFRSAARRSFIQMSAITAVDVCTGHDLSSVLRKGRGLVHE